MWFVNFHLTFIVIVDMYIVDIKKDVLNALIFFSAFLDLQSIRDDEATTSKELIFFNAFTDVPHTSRKKHKLKLQTLAKQAELFSHVDFSPLPGHTLNICYTPCKFSDI